jgi:hypothetical protein
MLILNGLWGICAGFVSSGFRLRQWLLRNKFNILLSGTTLILIAVATLLSGLSTATATVKTRKKLQTLSSDILAHGCDCANMCWDSVYIWKWFGA